MLGDRFLCDLDVASAALEVTKNRADFALCDLKEASACAFCDLLEILAEGFLVERALVCYEFSTRLAVVDNVRAAELLTDLPFVIEGRYGKLAEVRPFGKIVFPEGVYALAAAIGKESDTIDKSDEVRMNEFTVRFGRNSRRLLRLEETPHLICGGYRAVRRQLGGEGKRFLTYHRKIVCRQ